jgi:hypothetical protein
VRFSTFPPSRLGLTNFASVDYDFIPACPDRFSQRDAATDRDQLLFILRVSAIASAM